MKDIPLAKTNHFLYLPAEDLNLEGIGKLLAMPENKDFTNTLALVKKWVTGDLLFTFQTSGSTGKPKQVELHRDLMQLSARNTIEALQLQPGQTALHCMDSRFIGGAMMVIRALEGNMNLIVTAPTKNPLALNIPSFDFVAMVPMQLQTILQGKETYQWESLNICQTVLLGGGPIDPWLEEAVQSLKCNVVSSYGMTETISHVALRKVNGMDRSDSFHAVGDAEFRLSDADTLMIRGTITRGQWLTTNDVVEMYDKHAFKWVGRADFIINTGGIKVNPEEIESKLSPHIQAVFGESNFLIAGLPDPTYGQIVVLVIASKTAIEDSELHLLQLKSRSTDLPSYKFPKRLVVLPEIPLTASGKPDRGNTLKIITTEPK